MKVKPAIPGAVIRDPHTKRPLPAEGAEVPDNVYWHRRLIAGEVVRVGDVEPTGNEPTVQLTTRARR
ncbi:MAG TPA: DUF2635 domain-containing protein [Candidatus Binatia bacterium]|nr:DUF2635 domain-containing protein [Candidatus Binatia bacterium]